MDGWMDDEDRGEEGAAAGGWSRRSGEPVSQARVRSGPERDRCARRGGRDGRPGTTGAERTQHGRRGIRDPSAALAQSVGSRADGVDSPMRGGGGAPGKCEEFRGGARRWRESTWRGPGAVATGDHHRPGLNLFCMDWKAVARWGFSFVFGSLAWLPFRYVHITEFLVSFQTWSIVYLCRRRWRSVGDHTTHMVYTTALFSHQFERKMTPTIYHPSSS